MTGNSVSVSGAVGVRLGQCPTNLLTLLYSSWLRAVAIAATTGMAESQTHRKHQRSTH